MDPEQVKRHLGHLYLASSGDPDQAARTIAALVDQRAFLRPEEGELEHVENILIKICVIWPNKPEDYRAFMVNLRTQLFTREGAEAVALKILTQEFIALGTSETVLMFRRPSFFSERGSFRAFATEEIPSDWKAVPPSAGMTESLA